MDWKKLVYPIRIRRNWYGKAKKKKKYLLWITVYSWKKLKLFCEYLYMIHRFVCTRTALEKKETRPSISATNNRRKNLLVPNYRKLCLFLMIHIQFLQGKTYPNLVFLKRNTQFWQYIFYHLSKLFLKTKFRVIWQVSFEL